MHYLALLTLATLAAAQINIVEVRLFRYPNCVNANNWYYSCMVGWNQCCGYRNESGSSASAAMFK